LRQVEHAAKAIAAGELGARVTEKKMNSAKPLAQAFNHMASRTESLVRTQRELLQAVSHELRTPLSRMRFAIDLIEAAKDDEERQLRLDSLDAATEELDELVGELLSYVRMETTELPVEPEVVSVRAALADITGKYATLYSKVSFNVDDRVGEQHVVFADRHGFLRVLGNLLSNAGRFAKSQVVATAESDDHTTTVIVDDDGVGVPAGDRERIFEPFVRLEGADGNGRSGCGVGLGLALVKRIVMQNGASIEILESPLGGCRVRTRWPATRQLPTEDSP
jgi:two-component system sensor histidine kinase RstB